MGLDLNVISLGTRAGGGGRAGGCSPQPSWTVKSLPPQGQAMLEGVSGCSWASDSSPRALGELAGQPSERGSTGAFGCHPTQTRSVTVNYSRTIWRLDRPLDGVP